jgi:ElaB/YqjD/DUF883 family membrane-anchored ribosome-binding protein
MVQQIGDDRSDALPEGTDTVIEGASNADVATPESVNADTGTEDTPLIARRDSSSSSSSSSSDRGITDRIREGREQFASQAGERARGLVSQGLERTSETLANVSKMVGDTAAGIEERLGPEYGDYARRAAGAIENAANSIASKDPDELIEDTRTFVRNSPGIALAGAAVVGFVVARLFKSGLASTRDEED